MEFAVIFSALVLLLLWMVDSFFYVRDQNRLEQISVMTAELMATFPVYDTKTRKAVAHNTRFYSQYFQGQDLTVTIVPVTRQNGYLSTAFPPTNLFGSGSSPNWRNYVVSSEYVENEFAILVISSVIPTNFFGVFRSRNKKIIETHVARPYYSRRWDDSNGDVDYDYYNVP